MTPDMNLWPIGNCQVSALVDGTGRFVWGCVPRVDGVAKVTGRARYLDELAAWAQGQAPADAGLLRRFALSTLQQKAKKGRSAPTDLGGAFSALDAWCAHQEAAPDLATTLAQHAEAAGWPIISLR